MMSSLVMGAMIGIYLSFLGIAPQQAVEHRQNPVQESAASYEAVMAHLEPGGDLLFVLNAENSVKQMSSVVVNAATVFAQVIRAEGELDSATKIARVAVGVPSFLEDNGLLSLKAIGASIVPNGDGTHRSRKFFLRDPASFEKPLWKVIASGEPRDLVSHNYFSGNVALAASMTGDLSALLTIIDSAVSDLVPEAKPSYDAFLAQISEQLDVDIKQAIRSMDADAFFAVTLDASTPTAIPMGKEICTIPEPALLIGVKLNSSLIPERIAALVKTFEGAYPMASSMVGTVEVRTVQVPLPFGVSPSVAYNSQDGMLVIGTHESAVKAAIASAVAGTDRLFDTPAFQSEASAPLPPNNGMTYLSRRAVETLAKLQMALLSSEGDEKTAELIKSLYGLPGEGFHVAYTRNLPNGIETVSRSTRGAEQYSSMLFAAPIATTGILAAIAIPNFVKARSTSQRNACVSNLRQIMGAYEQAKLYGIDDPKPEDLFGTKGYIRVEPVCPVTKQRYEINADGVPVCPSGLPGHALPEY